MKFYFLLRYAAKANANAPKIAAYVEGSGICPPMWITLPPVSSNSASYSLPFASITVNSLPLSSAAATTPAFSPKISARLRFTSLPEEKSSKKDIWSFSKEIELASIFASEATVIVFVVSSSPSILNEQPLPTNMSLPDAMLEFAVSDDPPSRWKFAPLLKP